MRARRLAVGLGSLVLGLALFAMAQEKLSLSFGAGSLFPTGETYRQIYGSSLVLTGDVWFKLKGPVGITAGFGHLADDGLALAVSGGDEEYPVRFRRQTIPLVLFYEIEIGPIDIRAGAGAGFHLFKETWRTVDLDYSGNKIGPRFLLAASVEVIDRLSLLCSLTYDSLRKETGYPLTYEVKLGGFQLLGGLAFRIF